MPCVHDGVGRFGVDVGGVSFCPLKGGTDGVHHPVSFPLGVDEGASVCDVVCTQFLGGKVYFSHKS